MRHRKSRLRLRHKPAHSNALQRNLVTSLLLYESVRTTKKRAEVVQPIVDRLIAVAKKHDARNAIRSINRIVTHTNASKKIMEVLKARFAKRSSGFTRMEPVGARRGDGAQLVTLMLVEGEAVSTPAEKNPTNPKNPKSPRTKKSSASSPFDPTQDDSMANGPSMKATLRKLEVSDSSASSESSVTKVKA